MTSRRFDQVALFSMINWPCFQLSKCRQDGQSGPLFGDQMALFSFDKNTLPCLFSQSSPLYDVQASILFVLAVLPPV